MTAAALNLVQIACDTLRNEILPTVAADKRYAALMTINALQIAGRDLASGDTARQAMLDSLTSLVGPSCDHATYASLSLTNKVRDVEKVLCAAIERGQFDQPARRAELLECLEKLVVARLRITNPKAMSV